MTLDYDVCFGAFGDSQASQGACGKPYTVGTKHRLDMTKLDFGFHGADPGAYKDWIGVPWGSNPLSGWVRGQVRLTERPEGLAASQYGLFACRVAL